MHPSIHTYAITAHENGAVILFNNGKKGKFVLQSGTD